jgi:hypothetical protein
MASERELALHHNLLDDDNDNNEEGCEMEVMALVVIDEFPIEARYQHVILATSIPDQY